MSLFRYEKSVRFINLQTINKRYMGKNHYVQYIIVRKDVIDRYGIGVLASQICHASMAPITEQIRAAEPKTTIDSVFDKETSSWINGIFNKIVLEVPNLQSMGKLTERLYHEGIKYSEIHESSLDGELTCIGLKPYNKGRVAPYFKNLKKLGEK